MPLRRLPHSPETREKLSAAAAGRRHTDLAKLKIGVARLGKKHSPETIEKIRAARRARDVVETPEEQRRRNRSAWAKSCKARRRQWRQDLVIAHALGDPELLADIRRSKGRWSKRTVHHPLVSDGYRRGKLMWGQPRLLQRRMEQGLIKNYVGSGIPHKRTKNGTR